MPGHGSGPGGGLGEGLGLGLGEGLGLGLGEGLVPVITTSAQFRNISGGKDCGEE